MSTAIFPTANNANGSEFACIAVAWQAYHAELLGYLTHRLSDATTANDVLHDVFVKAMRQGQGFCVLDQPRAWLFQVARNTLVDRARAAHPALPLPDGDDELAAPDPQTLAPIDALASCLGRCLAELADADAAILRACDLNGQTMQAFAHAHSLRLAAGKSRLLRARQRLRAQLTRSCQVQFADDGKVDGHVPREPGDATAR